MVLGVVVAGAGSLLAEPDLTLRSAQVLCQNGRYSRWVSWELVSERIFLPSPWRRRYPSGQMIGITQCLFYALTPLSMMIPPLPLGKDFSGVVNPLYASVVNGRGLIWTPRFV